MDHRSIREAATGQTFIALRVFLFLYPFNTALAVHAGQHMATYAHILWMFAWEDGL